MLNNIYYIIIKISLNKIVLDFKSNIILSFLFKNKNNKFF